MSARAFQEELPKIAERERRAQEHARHQEALLAAAPRPAKLDQATIDPATTSTKIAISSRTVHDASSKMRTQQQDITLTLSECEVRFDVDAVGLLDRVVDWISSEHTVNIGQVSVRAAIRLRSAPDVIALNGSIHFPRVRLDMPPLATLVDACEAIDRCGLDAPLMPLLASASYLDIVYALAIDAGLFQGHLVPTISDIFNDFTSPSPLRLAAESIVSTFRRSRGSLPKTATIIEDLQGGQFIQIKGCIPCYIKKTYVLLSTKLEKIS